MRNPNKTRECAHQKHKPNPQSEKNRTRIVYNSLLEHDYSVDKPTLREIKPGHFVRCNDAEEKRYKEALGL